jgi:diacylglycerol kinase
MNSARRKPEGFWRGEVFSFGNAFRGIGLVVREVHMRMHVVAAMSVLGLAAYWQVDALRWAVLLVTISSVMGAEASNSAIERLAKYVNPMDVDNRQIGNALDVAAAAVLIRALAAPLVGLCVFWPHFVNLF